MSSGEDGQSPLVRWQDALARTPALTSREREVFRALGSGMSTADIATRLLVSQRTVKRHVGDIMEKLGLASRLQVGIVASLTLVDRTHWMV